jgi:hypothetical protein
LKEGTPSFSSEKEAEGHLSVCLPWLMDKSFLVLFSKKEHSFLLAYAAIPPHAHGIHTS